MFLRAKSSAFRYAQGIRWREKSGRRAKANAFLHLIRVDTINGKKPEELANRLGFDFLTPSYPERRLKLETTPHELTGRTIDLVAPIGFGQRGLIMAPPNSQKVELLRLIARAVQKNTPGTVVLTLLLGAQPETILQFEGDGASEVVASPFDAVPGQHIQIADLVFEKSQTLC